MRQNCIPRRLVLAVLIMAMFATSTQADQAPKKAKKIAEVEGITEYRLENNGFRYLLFPDPSSSTVTINLTVFVGSRHEGYGETGMAHLLEHMVFKGSKLYPDTDKALQEHGAGASANGTTWVDRTNYYETMPATDENLEFGIKFEADRLVNSFIRREDLAKEMTVVRNEFERGENNPIYILRQRIMATAFEWHNYGKSTIGNRSDIERVPIENLQAFYRKYYQPDNVLLVIAGKFDEKKAHQYVAKYFGALPKPKRKLSNTYTEEPAQDGERVVILRRVGSIAVVGVAYHIPAAAHPDCSAAQVLARALTSAPSGRLYKALVETKKATAVGGSAFTWHDPGVLTILALVGKKSTPDEVRDIILEEIDKLKKDPLTKKEVGRAKAEILAQQERLLTKSQRAAIMISEWAGAGDWRLMFVHRDRIADMNTDDVNAVAERYLKQSNRTVGLFYPTEKVSRAEIPPAPSVQDIVQKYKGKKSLSAGEKFDPTPENIENRVKRLQLPSGLKVALLPKKTRGNAVVANLSLRFGNEKSLKDLTTAAGFLGPLMKRGTKNYSRQELTDKLNELRATLSVGSGTGAITASIQAKKDTLPAVLALLEEILRRPTFPEKEFDILQRQELQGLREGLTDPNSLAFNALSRKINPYPKDSIHYVPTLEEKISRTEKVNKDEIVQIYKNQVGGTVGELAIVGDFDEASALKKLNQIFSNWEAKIPYKRISRLPIINKKGSKTEIETPDKKNAIYLAGYPMRMTDNDPKYPAMRMANYILGGSGLTSLLFDRLRTKEGLSYGAASRFYAGTKDPYSQFFIFATANPENIEKVENSTADVLEKVLKSGFSQTQLEESVRGYLLKQQVSRSRDSSLAGSLRSGLYLGRTFEKTAKIEEQIKNLTLKEVNAAVRDLVHTDRLIIVTAGDFKKKSK